MSPMAATSEFSPDWVSAPGDTIAEILAERNLSSTDFAVRIGCTPTEARDLLAGRMAITIDLASRLSRLLGASPEFWMARDYQYHENVARLERLHSDWAAKFPISDMIEYGWMPPVAPPSSTVRDCLRYFDVSSVELWSQRYVAVQQLVAFRASTAFESRRAAIAAWLRQGEILSNDVTCAPWNAERFRQTVSEVRQLTRLKDPAVFVPRLRAACATAGVAVVVVRTPSGCRASGASRFLLADKALIMLSFRHLTDDHFWFTFFHEGGHLLLHADRELFVDEEPNAATDQEEREANEFAAAVLVPYEFATKLATLPLDARSIIRFAGVLGVSPGIIVGQLQHRGRLGYQQMSRLKRRYRWHA